MKRYLLVFLIISFLCIRLNAQLIALKTDALLDCAMTPNLNVEMVIAEKSSINASVFGNYKPWGQKIKMIGLMPEYRFWFNGRPMTREFIGVALLAANYDITWAKEVYNGDAVGIGFTFGYTFRLSTYWNLECYGCFGAVYYDQKHYYTKDNYENFGTQRNSFGYALIPFKLGVSFSYIIK